MRSQFTVSLDDDLIMEIIKIKIRTGEGRSDIINRLIRAGLREELATPGA